MEAIIDSTGATGIYTVPGLKPAGGLESYSTVFCDSLQAIRAAQAAGLGRDAQVLTRSPALLVRKDLAAVHLDARTPGIADRLDTFFLGTTDFLHTCFKSLMSRPETRPFGILVCREIWKWQQHAVFAAFLERSDYTEPRLIIDAVPQDDIESDRYRLPWRSLLSSNYEAAVFNVPLETEPELTTREAEPVIDRLRIRGPEHFAWRLFQIIWRKIPKHWTKRSFVYLKDSELVRDVGLAFAMRGYRIRHLTLPSGSREDEARELAGKLLMTISDLLSPRIRLLAPEAGKAILYEILAEALSRQLQDYFATEQYLERQGGDLLPDSRSVVVTNYPQGGGALALAHYCAEKGITFAGAQHGVGRELLNAPQNQCNYENSTGPAVLLFSPQSCTVTGNSPFRHREAAEVCVGLPADYGRVGKYGRFGLGGLNLPPVLYVQMLGRTGGFFNGSIYKDDLDHFRHEKGLIERVFERIPHKVGFKCYPHSSYADPDPVFDVARQAKNVELILYAHDLRFLAQKARVLITVGTSSTLGWCLCSGKPVVYIDTLAAGYRLSETLRVDYPDAVFYFDGRDPDYLSKLRVFLSRPIEEIEAQWQAGEASRAAFIREFVGVPGRATGHIAYRWLQSRMQTAERR